MQTGPKGSYRTEHVVAFLQRHLCEASENRDWRIITADIYGPHADSVVWDLCWSRMYVLVIIGGGITGILQVCDTHLHYPLSVRYQDIEMQDLVQQQLDNPNVCPGRTREACVRDLCASWRDPALHQAGQRGFWDNMLANALDGSEDH